MAEHLVDKACPPRLQRVSCQVLLGSRGLAGGSGLNLIRLRPHPRSKRHRSLPGRRNPNRHHRRLAQRSPPFYGNTESSRPIRVPLHRSVRAPVWSPRVTTFVPARDRTMASKAVAPMPARVTDDRGRAPSRNDSSLPIDQPFRSRQPGSRACGAAMKRRGWVLPRRGSRGLRQRPCLVGFERRALRTG
jgi:hypothetical protein